MPAIVTVCHKWYSVPNQHQRGTVVIDATSSGGWTADLSPFLIGPCRLYDTMTPEHEMPFRIESLNMENLWQYAKVYQVHADENGNPTQEYWAWAREGWANPRAVRYPMGKGARPLYSLWKGKKLGYIDARKQIYGPCYAEAVQRTEGWDELVRLYNESDHLFIRDWDGWLMDRHGCDTLSDVLNKTDRIMGHAFVLKMLLENDPALEQMEMR